MEFYKKVLVLKEVNEGFSVNGKQVCGILRAEEENGVVSVYLSLVNFSGVSAGTFNLFLLDCEGKLFHYDVGSNPLSFHVAVENFASLRKGISVGVAYINDDIPTLVAFATSETGKNLSILKKAIVEKCIEKRRVKKKTESPAPTFFEEKTEDKKDNLSTFSNVENSEEFLDKKEETARPDFSPKKEVKSCPKEYDDEAVATCNYFKEEEIKEKLERIEKISDGFTSVEDGKEPFSSGEKEEEERENFDCLQDEKDNSNGREYSLENPYYDEVKDDLEKLFDKFEKEPPLCQTVPESDWVKIYYSTDKYYVVGKVFCDGHIKYICYGVPAVYSKEPPKELKGFCSFVPTSVFRLKGDGYWMMFQDAITGQCVRMDG